mgnify:FL=1
MHKAELTRGVSLSTWNIEFLSIIVGNYDDMVRVIISHIGYMLTNNTGRRWLFLL